MLREIPLEAFFQDAKVWVGQSKPQCCSQIQFVQPEFQPRDLVAGVQRPWAQQDFHHLIPPKCHSQEMLTVGVLLTQNPSLYPLNLGMNTNAFSIQR